MKEDLIKREYIEKMFLPLYMYGKRMSFEVFYQALEVNSNINGEVICPTILNCTITDIPQDQTIIKFDKDGGLIELCGFKVIDGVVMGNNFVSKNRKKITIFQRFLQYLGFRSKMLQRKKQYGMVIMKNA